MSALDRYLEDFPDAARDLRLNLRAVLGESTLDERTRFGTALACAYAVEDGALVATLLEEGAAHLDEGLREDAQAAAVLMAMNNVYYRFRHFTGKEEYLKLPARLRMSRLGAPKNSKSIFEFCSLAVSAINGCETCVQAHEASLRALGETPERIQDAARIAAVVRAASLAKKLAGLGTRVA